MVLSFGARRARMLLILVLVDCRHSVAVCPPAGLHWGDSIWRGKAIGRVGLASCCQNGSKKHWAMGALFLCRCWVHKKQARGWVCGVREKYAGGGCGRLALLLGVVIILMAVSK
jgi:hypothetical protein